MITNYYLKRIPTEEEIAQCHRLLDERKIDSDDLCDEKYDSSCLESVFAKITERIHLGKYSDGWRFLFRTNSKLYGKSIRACLDYINGSQKSGLWRLMDEYGRTVTIEEFEKWVRKSMEGITINDYYRKHPEERRWGISLPQEEVAEDGSRWLDDDFF